MATDNVTPLNATQGDHAPGVRLVDPQRLCLFPDGERGPLDPVAPAGRFVSFNPTADDYNVPGGGGSRTVFLDSQASNQALVLLASSRAERLRALLDLFASSSCERGVELSEVGLMILPQVDELCAVLRVLEARSENGQQTSSHETADAPVDDRQ